MSHYYFAEASGHFKFSKFEVEPHEYVNTSHF